MNRLTKKMKSGEYFSIAESVVFDEEQQCINKLGQLEDIEEELGTKMTDLSICLLASKNGFYTKRSYENIKTRKKECLIEFHSYAYCYFSEDTNSWWVATIDANYPLYNYKRTWSLVKEDLEQKE